MRELLLPWTAGSILLAFQACGGGGGGQDDADAAGDPDAEPADGIDVNGEQDADADVPPDLSDAADVPEGPDGDAPSDVCPSEPVCEAGSGRCYYIAPNPRSGSGTFDDPFGLDDLPRGDTSYCELSSPAMEALQPGDILYFREGHYELQGCPGDYYAVGNIRPARSGEPDNPITVSAYPCETVRLTVVGGGQPAMGDDGHDYFRVIGFVVDGGLGRFMGTGGEIAYNEVAGTFVDTSDNHDGIRLENTVGVWVHHNVVHGVTGLSQNSAGIKLYDTTDSIIEDNYIHGNTAGIFDKDSGINNTYRRNFITANEDSQWYGNNQDRIASPRIYENVIDGHVELHFLTDGAEVHDNLVRGAMLAGAWAGEVWNTSLWNNVVISHGAEITAYREPQSPFTNEEPQPHLRYMDYNVYDAPTRYDFGEYTSAPSTFDMAGMQAMGYEEHAQVAAGVYVDEVSYALSAGWEGAGRDGDPVGPDDVALILDLGRYGPAARPVPY